MNIPNTATYYPEMLRHGAGHKENRTLTVIYVLICALMPLWRSVWLLPALSVNTYYALFGLLIVITMLTGRCRIHWSLVWFLAWCAASILVNVFSSYFTPWPRLAGLAVIIAGAGPLVANFRLFGLKKRALTVMMWGFVVIAVISFVLYYTARPLTMYQGFLFMGITGNSMLMSPIAAVGALYLMQWYMERRHELSTWQKLLIWTVWTVCVFTAILAGSRSALLSFIIALLVWLWLYIHSTRRFAWILIGIIAVVAATSPAWGSYTETLDQKMEASQKAGGILSSREALWEQRWQEFKKSPVFGIGFSKVDKMTDDTDTESLTGGRGIVEPGNGWLFALSSTGIGGFALLLWFYLTQLWKLIRIRTFESRLLLSLLVFIGVHSFAEGYLLSSGSLFCLLFWLCLGVSVCIPRPRSKFILRV